MTCYRCYREASDDEQGWAGLVPAGAPSENPTLYFCGDCLHAILELGAAEPQAVEEPCIRCGTLRAIEADGYCGRCYWIARREAADGLGALEHYLERWTEFRRWEEEQA